MADGARIVITGDNSDFDSKAEKSKEKVKGIAKASASVGDEFIKINSHAAKALLKFGSILAMLNAVTQAAKAVQDKTAEISKKSGGSALDRAKSLAKLGFGNDVNDLITRGAGGASGDERNSFASALGGVEGLSKDQAVAAITAFNSGAFSEDELIKKLKNGEEITTADTNKRIAGLPQNARDELRARAAEHDSETHQADYQAAEGSDVRAKDAAIAAKYARHPVSFAAHEALGNIPVIGGGLQSGVDLLNRWLEPVNRVADNTTPKPAVHAGKEEAP